MTGLQNGKAVGAGQHSFEKGVWAGVLSLSVVP